MTAVESRGAGIAACVAVAAAAVEASRTVLAGWVIAAGLAAVWLAVVWCVAGGVSRVASRVRRLR